MKKLSKKIAALSVGAVLFLSVAATGCVIIDEFCIDLIPPLGDWNELCFTLSFDLKE